MGDTVQQAGPQSSIGVDCVRDDFGNCVPPLEAGTATTEDSPELDNTGISQTTDNSGFGVGGSGITSEGLQTTWIDPTQHLETQVATMTTTGMVATVTLGPTTQAAATAKESNGSGLSQGAIAGIAVGALVIGAVTAFLAALFIFKRRKADREINMGNVKAYTSYAESTPELVMMQQTKTVDVAGRNSPYVQIPQTPLPAPIPGPAPLQHQRSPANVDTSFLPAAAHDTAIQSRVSALFNNIHHHVETYYRDVHVSLTPSMESDLARYGATGTNMAELLQDCSSPTSALKHALVAYVLGITGPRRKDGDSVSLFPEQLKNMTREVHGGANPTGVVVAAATLHRRLTVYLYTETSGSSNARRSRIIQSDVREAAEHFSLTFFPWANPSSSDQAKDEDLARIISEALDVRVWLYGQPYEYEFEWEGTGRRGVLVSPGLVRNNEDDKRDWVVEGVIVGT